MIDNIILITFAIWTLTTYMNYHRASKILREGGSLMEKECVALITSKWVFWLNCVTILVVLILALSPKHLLWWGPITFFAMNYIAARIWVAQTRENEE